uniref:Putative selenium-dependent hydroxylase accessory protein YqeC n=1 Tax=Fundidesulfovibrio putealis TaxID=270496 RepID=A0A7C4ELX0_9BACT
MRPLCELLLPGERVVALVGGGGKTSLMYALGRQLAGRGARVLVTTTTRIKAPARNLFLLGSRPDAPPYTLLTVGTAVEPDSGKLVGVEPGDIPELMERFRADLVLVEADGAKGRPLKAPLAHEPVIPACADLVIGVLGLDALGQVVDGGTVFRMEAFCAVTGLVPGDVIGPDAYRALAEHPQGIFKGCPASARRVAFHNKADIGGALGRVYGSAQLGWFVSLE